MIQVGGGLGDRYVFVSWISRVFWFDNGFAIFRRFRISVVLFCAVVLVFYLFHPNLLLHFTASYWVVFFCSRLMLYSIFQTWSNLTIPRATSTPFLLHWQ